MSIVIPSLRAAVAVPGWAKNVLWRNARTLPSLDLRFAENKSLTDAVTGRSLISFTRASSATYIDSAGTLQTVAVDVPRFDHAITASRTNLLLRSEEFNDASWSKVNTTVTANSIAAPNGTVTADTITDSNDASAAIHSVTSQNQSFTSGLLYTVSVYARAGTQPGVAFVLPAAAFTSNLTAAFNISTGSIISFDSGMTGSITAVGGGWYRCTATATATATASSSTATQIRIATASTSFYQGNGTGTISLWGAQLEQSSTVGEYIPTTTAPVTVNTTESLGLLVEEQRTNSIRNNTMVGAVAGTPGTLPTNWSAFSWPTGVTRSVIGTGTQNGIAYIDIRFNGTASGAGELSIFPEGTGALLFTAGTILSGSVWLSLVGGSTSNIASVTLRTVSYLGAAYVSEGNAALSITPTLTRFAFNNYTTAATSDRVLPAVSVNVAAAGAIDITLRIGLPQLEQGAFATSVIPTSTAAATRSADVASITGANFSSWYRQDEGTVFADVVSAPSNTIAQLAADISDALGNERIFIRRTGSGLIGVAVIDGGVTQADVSAGPVISGSARYATAVSYRLNSINLATNGQIGTEDTTATIPTPDRMFIGQNFASTQQANGTIRRLVYWGQRLPNNVLQAITQ